MAAALAIALATVAAGPSALRAETKVPFPRPAPLEPNVQFWVNVFTAYSIRDFVILDRDKVWRIYQVMHLPGDGSPSRDDIEWANAYLKSKYGEMLARLAAGHEPNTSEERRVAEMFKGEPPSAYAAAAQNLRVQEGLRERFREGLVRSRYYRPTMERIFTQAGVPAELVTLAQVESGFVARAKSGAGAKGIWQFTRSTGRKYLRITRYRDDRFNPIRETEAAAKLLRYNYDVLGDWPLAITAYDYGANGVARAAEECGNDYCRMIREYNGPHFGFAVKNYYSEFLAALQVHRYEEDYFPGISAQSPEVEETHDYTVRRGDTPAGIATMYGITAQQLLDANGLSDPRKIRAGATLVIPVEGVGESAPARSRAKPSRARKARHAAASGARSQG
ncbi:MAG TPA: transglycosylase SLT domain-containing protein [Candidatus Binataceae bacterium]|nr:transglycosylase SLT domain-containing protein [Candidatus Binataceae bacterium]